MTADLGGNNRLTIQSSFPEGRRYSDKRLRLRSARFSHSFIQKPEYRRGRATPINKKKRTFEIKLILCTPKHRVVSLQPLGEQQEKTIFPATRHFWS
jgi:hypothetical protein